jgi:multiple sugar transport system permease protein
MRRGSGARPAAVQGARYLLLSLGAAVMVLPFVYMLSTSLKSKAFVLETPPRLLPEHPTLANYAEALQANHFGRYFLNSLGVALATTALTVLLASMMAFAFARFEFPGKRLAFGLLLVGLMIPTMMLLVPQFVLAKNLHLLDSLPGLLPFYVGGALALNTFLIRGFFEGVPKELDEAMVVDGAGVWTRYWRLAMPLARPALATSAIFSFLASWDEFVWALTVINDPDNRTLPIGIALFQGEHSTSWGLVFAASMIAVVPVIIVYVTFQRHFVAGLTVGAVKS